MKNLKRWALVGLVIVLVVIWPDTIHGQCPMCRITAESNLANGGNAGEGLNNGILYMLAAPYLLIGVIAYAWWRNRRKNEHLATEKGEY